MLGIIGGSGKIGGATLDALLSEKLIPASDIVCTTSATSKDDPRWTALSAKGVHVRHATFDDGASIEKALAGCDSLYLVSSPRINLDFEYPKPGREEDHFVAIEAARKADVKHIYYTSLAFANPSKAGVFVAHERTEKYLAGLKDVQHTIIREGLYNESWPLYLGHYDVKSDDRSVVPVGGDSAISWTSIADLGLANALVLAAPSVEWAGKTFYLSNTHDPKTLKEIAGIVSQAKGKEIRLKTVSRAEHEEYYVKERKMPEGLIRWWASTYDALRDEECLIKDDTFDRLLASKGRAAKPVAETIHEMVQAAERS